MFEKIIKDETFKGAWHELKNLYGGNEKLKMVKLQTLRNQFKMTQMKEDEPVSEFFLRVVLLSNQTK